MSNGNQEQERLKRLKEQQIRARNPQKKQQQFQRMTAQRERKLDRSYSLGRAWRDISHIWRYSIYGFLLGVVALVALPALWASPWATPASIVALVILVAFGGMIGNAIDVRENLKDHLRR